MKYVGNYDAHECKVLLKNVSLSDQGRWTCEVESYVYGIARGSVANGEIKLQVVPSLEIFKECGNYEVPTTTVEQGSTPYVQSNSTVSQLFYIL